MLRRSIGVVAEQLICHSATYSPVQIRIAYLHNLSAELLWAYLTYKVAFDLNQKRLMRYWDEMNKMANHGNRMLFPLMKYHFPARTRPKCTVTG